MKSILMMLVLLAMPVLEPNGGMDDALKQGILEEPSVRKVARKVETTGRLSKELLDTLSAQIEVSRSL